MKISMLVMAVSLLTVLASCSNESPIEVTQEVEAQDVQKAETFTPILYGVPGDVPVYDNDDDKGDD